MKVGQKTSRIHKTRAATPPKIATTTDSTTRSQPHSVESGVRREILSDPGISVASLVVRRIPNGVCLEGVVHLREGKTDVNTVARRVLGVCEVQNHMLFCRHGGC